MTRIVVDIPHKELSQPELEVSIDIVEIDCKQRLQIEFDAEFASASKLGNFLDGGYFLSSDGQIFDASGGSLRIVQLFSEAIECSIRCDFRVIEADSRYLEFATGLFGEMDCFSMNLGDDAKAELDRRMAVFEEPIRTNLLDCELMDFQVDAVRFLRMRCETHRMAMLANEQGTGKTFVAIGLVADLVARTPHALALVVCPASVIQSWVEHFAKCAPSIAVEVIDGPQKRRAERIAACESQVLICSYGCMRRDAGIYAGLRLDLLVMDEVAGVRNYSAKTSIAARKLRAVSSVGMSGTPLHNSLTDLYSEFACLGGNYFGSMKKFRKRFVLPIEERGDDDAVLVFRYLAEPLIRRQLKDEVLDLPPMENIDIRVELHPGQAEMYKELEAGARNRLVECGDGEFAEARMEILALFTKLRQCAVSASAVDEGYHGGSAKIDMAVEMVARFVAEGSKVCVFTLFKRGVIDELVARLGLEGIECAVLTGETPVGEREGVIRKFSLPKGPSVIVITNAGSEGLNIQAADVEVQLSVWFNRAVEQQAAARIHRIGSFKNVRIYRLIATGTIEEKMVGISERKWEIARSVLEQPEKPLTRMSRSELLELLG